MPAATQVDVLLKWNGGGGRSGPDASGTGSKPAAKDTDKGEKPSVDTPIFKKLLGGVGKFVKGQLGLNFGVGALLKQSQIFTSTIGVIFQLLGALIDVMLAPLLPMVMPLIRWLAKGIPLMQRLMQNWIVPLITGISEVLKSVWAWVDGFLSTWDGSLERLLGPEGIGGLTDKFRDWWKSTASPWLGETLIDVRDSIGQKIVDIWEWFKGTDTRVKGWIIAFFITQTGRLLKWLVTLPVFLLKLLFKIPGFLVKMTSGLIKMMFPFFGGIFVRAIGAVSGFFTSLGGRIITPIKKLPELIYKGALSLISLIMKGLGGVLGKLPFIGGKLEKMLGGVSKLVTAAKNPKVLASSIGKVLGGGKLLTALGGVAKLTKAIPVVGAVATAGFGAYEVSKAVASGEYAKAGALATKTVIATGLTGVGLSGLGLATDVIGTLAASQIGKKTNGAVQAINGGGLPGSPPVAGGDLTVALTINNNSAAGVTQEQVTHDLKVKVAEGARIENEFGNEL